MKITSKTSIIAITLLAVLSVSSISFAVATSSPGIVEKTGHSFLEDYWAIEWDVLSNQMKYDYTPGPLADQFNDTSVDPTPNWDANYYVSYFRTGQVQTIYMALLDYSRDVYNNTYYGISPYQMLQQHFRTAGGKHVVVQNTFAGLLAYQNNNTNNSVPDREDRVYYGQSIQSQYYKHVLNNVFETQTGERFLNEQRLPTATPMPIEHEVTNTTFKYTFGMSYENLFFVWARMDLDQNFTEAVAGRDLLSRIVAFSTLKSLNFTYTISGDVYEDRPVNVTTTTEYDIGAVDDLWIVDESQSHTETLGGTFYNIWFSPHTLSRYNTSETIENRLAGNEDLPGFSLAVANYARVTVIAASVADQNAFEIRDQNNRTVDGDHVNQTASCLNLRAANRPAFKIDFASKPDYTLDGGAPMPAPVKLYPNLAIKDRSINNIDGLTMRFLNGFNRAMVQARIDHVKEKYNITNDQINIDVNKRNVFYAICFPEWGGKTINQDPTFVAYADPGELIANIQSKLANIDGFNLGVLALAGLVGIVSTFAIIRRKHNKVSQF
ncbi:MAG: hypothetical protein ACTSVU_00475 [Promethearchaeota archaeon]